MSRGLRHMTEARIRAADAKGELSGLEGEGKPLPNSSGDAYVDIGTQVGHRIMAEAGAIPEEIRLKRALDDARARYNTTTDPAVRKAAMAEIARLDLAHAIARDARQKFLK